MAILELFSDLMKSHNLAVFFARPPYEGLGEFDGGLRTKILNRPPAENFAVQLQKRCVENTFFLATDDFGVNYLIFKMPQNLRRSGEFVIAGPYLYTAVTKEKIETQMTAFAMPPAIFAELTEYYNSLPIIDGGESWTSLLTVLASHLFGTPEKVEIVETTLNLESPDEIFEFKIESQEPLSVAKIEARYAAEEAMLSAVTAGNEKKALAANRNFLSYRLLPRNADVLRDKKNLMIVFNTLMRKAVQQGQVHPAHIDEISSYYSKKIEAAATVKQLVVLPDQMIKKYCALVTKFSLSGYSALIKEVINHIDFYYAEDLSLAFLAEKFAVNDSYLSSQFHRETKITLTDYINNRRIEHGVLLLDTTDYPIHRIASECGFGDVNYFTRVFKKFQGESPSSYRSAKKKLRSE